MRRPDGGSPGDEERAFGPVVEKDDPGLRGRRTNRGYRRGRWCRVKRRMLRCRQIDIDIGSLSRAAGQRVIVHHDRGTPPDGAECKHIVGTLQ